MHTITLSRAGERSQLHAEVLAAIQGVVVDEPDLIANLANITAILKDALAGASWVGFYRKIGPDLVLGPFQGKLACTRIGPGQGVCGAAAVRRAPVLVPDVDKFPGHIACDSATRSEVVVPVVHADGRVVAVLDLDSSEPGHFDEVDAAWLQQVAEVAAGLAW